MAVFKRLPGSARRYVDLESGKEYSRRQVDALRGRVTRKNARAVKHKIKLYYGLLDDYIAKKKQKGVKLTKKKAMQSEEMKQIVKDLKSKDMIRKRKALEKTIRRDGVPELIPVGETPNVYSDAA